jgi:outer membrane immunogenic protein
MGLGKIIKRSSFLVAGVAAAGIGAIATAAAADLTPAPMYAKTPAPVTNYWGGIQYYTGANLGGAFASQDVTASGSGSLGGNSIYGGGYTGFTWLVAPTWIVGIEGDIEAAHLSDTVTLGPGQFSRTISGIASGRGRAGYLVTPNILVYGAGGAAWALGSNYSASNFIQGDIVGTSTGWTAGGGVEWALDSHWRARAEYLYYDLPGKSGDSSYVPSPAPNFGDLKVNAGRVGIAYAF